ncbi:hypothetical protein BJ138DRAFT_1116751 [Hygrophoropsis aurantiaca]|uniref:Uncharacterized protein n=1 Tax=Hygrophoropsis aurantiaca TaxID=72124 RepID=A0ACB8A1Z7_9AGAM|nr:hypothetical protein BJ138DRAFT_1116751 [Hygrophoropsis aurantiaca]
MHRALSVPELLDELFSYYHTQAGWDADRSAKHRTLLALALACRTFQDHAIAALWRQLDSFRRPILCFLRNAVEPPNPPVTRDTGTNLDGEDWDRFGKYASHIRELTIEHGDFRGVFNFMAFLSVKYLPRGSQGHLLPKLRTLTWLGDHTTDLPFIHLFAPPSSPNLKTLRIRDCQIDIFVSLFRSAQMPLESIALQLYHHDHDPYQPPFFSQSSLGDLISLIATRPCQNSLKELEMHYFPDPDGSDRLDSALNITILRPLFIFSNLRLCHVEIEGTVADPTFDLNDDALVELAAAWPHLETLVFKRHVGWHNTSAITFNGLASLLRGCPLLETLTLSMNATQLDYAFTGEGALNRWVKRLDLGDSIIEEPTTVALILADLFGSLEKVDTWHRGRNSNLYQPLWGEVNSILEREREEEGSEGSQMSI